MIQQRGHARREAPPILRFVEDVETAEIKNEVEWGGVNVFAKEVCILEPAIQARVRRFRTGSADSDRRDVYAKNRKALPGEPQRIGTRTAANVEGASSRQ